jgi:hypothetical protein
LPLAIRRPALTHFNRRSGYLKPVKALDAQQVDKLLDEDFARASVRKA